MKLRDYAKKLGLDVGCQSKECQWGACDGEATNEPGCDCYDRHGAYAEMLAFAKVGRAVLDEVEKLDCPDPDEVGAMAAEIQRRRAKDPLPIDPAADALAEQAMARNSKRGEGRPLALSDADREALRFLLTTYGNVPDDRGEREVYDNNVHAARLLCERLLKNST